MSDVPSAQLPALIRSSPVLLVRFGAGWCAPCAALDRQLDLYAAGTDAVTVARVDIDAEPAVAQQHEITALPTMIVFRDGRPAGRVAGTLPAAHISDFVRSVRTS